MTTQTDIYNAATALGLEPTQQDGRVICDCGSFLLTAAVGKTCHLEARWQPQPDAADYVEATLLANNANCARLWPGFEVSDASHDVAGALRDGHPLCLYAHVHHPLGATTVQLEDLWRSGFAAGVELNAVYGAAFPEAAKQLNQAAAEAPALEPSSLQQPEDGYEPVTRERLESWFAARGVGEIPYDEDNCMMNLCFDGTGVDIVLTDPLVFNVQISAPVRQETRVDTGTIMHLCNRENARSIFPTACVLHEESGWWVTSKVVMPIAQGLSDSQCDDALRLGIGQAAGQLRTIMHKL